MYTPKTYIQMQQLQDKHDTNYHQDIAVLDTQARLKHLTLHFGKYSGRLDEAKGLEQHELKSQLEKTSTDTFIITSSAANVLNLDLDEIMVKKGRSPLIYEYPANGSTTVEQIRGKTMYGLVIGQAKLAKSLESMDHMEEGPHRMTVESGVVKIAETVLEGSSTLKFDLVDETLNRWQDVEKNKLL